MSEIRQEKPRVTADDVFPFDAAKVQAAIDRLWPKDEREDAAYWFAVYLHTKRHRLDGCA